MWKVQMQLFKLAAQKYNCYSSVSVSGFVSLTFCPEKSTQEKDICYPIQKGFTI